MFLGSIQGENPSLEVKPMERNPGNKMNRTPLKSIRTKCILLICEVS
jgi:hypothetical protein